MGLSAAMVLPVFMAGCSGALWGNLGVLLLTVGIFWGTLSLGRRADTTLSAQASASNSRRMG